MTAEEYKVKRDEILASDKANLPRTTALLLLMILDEMQEIREDTHALRVMTSNEP